MRELIIQDQTATEIDILHFCNWMLEVIDHMWMISSVFFKVDKTTDIVRQRWWIWQITRGRAVIALAQLYWGPRFEAQVTGTNAGWSVLLIFHLFLLHCQWLGALVNSGESAVAQSKICWNFHFQNGHEAKNAALLQFCFSERTAEFYETKRKKIWMVWFYRKKQTEIWMVWFYPTKRMEIWVVRFYQKRHHPLRNQDNSIFGQFSL